MPTKTELNEAASSPVAAQTTNLRYYGNFITKVTVTSLAVSLATSPLHILTTRRQMVGEITLLASARAWGRSMPSYVASGQTKGAMSVSSKNLPAGTGADVPTEAPTSRENTPAVFLSSKLFQGGVFSQVEAIAPSYFANKSKLTSAGINVGPMTTYNLRKLVFTGYPIRSMTCAFNFTSILFVSDKISGAMPFQNPVTANFAGGALSGMLNALLTHPLNEAHDRLMLKTTLGQDGKLKVVAQLVFSSKHLKRSRRLV